MLSTWHRFCVLKPLVLVNGVLSHAAAAGKSKDHVVAVVDVRACIFLCRASPKDVRRAA